MRLGTVAGVLALLFRGSGLFTPKSGAPKGTLAADPRNKRGNFSSRTKAWRLQAPAPRPNCRAEYEDRVTVGKSAFIYPNNPRAAR